MRSRIGLCDWHLSTYIAMFFSWDWLCRANRSAGGPYWRQYERSCQSYKWRPIWKYVRRVIEREIRIAYRCYGPQFPIWDGSLNSTASVASDFVKITLVATLLDNSREGEHMNVCQGERRNCVQNNNVVVVVWVQVMPLSVGLLSLSRKW